jgi:hypothetical protein
VSLTLGGDENLYALTATGEVAQSTDDGATWTVVGTMPVSDAVSIRRMSASLFVLTTTGFAYRSDDAGSTWTPVGTASQVGMRGLTQIGAQLLALTKEGLTARSTDGASWTWVGSVNQLEVVAIANDIPQAVGVPEHPGTTPHIVLAPPRPNPLRTGQVLTVAFALPKDDRIRLELFDVAGRLVAQREPVFLAAGDEAELAWDPGPLSGGVYFLRVRADSGFESGRRLVVLR